MRYFLCGLVVGLFLVSKTNAQKPFKDYNQICYYVLEYQPDSTDVKNKKKEDMVLLINEGQSLFLSFNQFAYDSVSYQMYKKTGNAGGNMAVATAYRTDFMYRIYKNNDSIETLDKGGRDFFLYNEKIADMQWILQPDTATISGLKCQKASLNFGNRKWTAWFAPSIPLLTGPYKFAGLPGLIVKMQDSRQFYVFTLRSIQNRKSQYQALGMIKPPTRTTKQKFLEYVNLYKENRFQMDQQNGIKFTSGADEIKKRLDTLAKKDNNRIELVSETREENE